VVPLCALLVIAVTLSAISYRNTISPDGIVIHHAALPPSLGGRKVDVEYLDAAHRQRGFRIFYWGRFYYVGYHYIILPDGTVQQGRPERSRGAHTTGNNSFIGVCLVGDFSARHPERGGGETTGPTAAQMHALVELINRLRGSYGIPLERVVRHRDVNADSRCPGELFPFSQLMERLRQR
jgi:N-acetyl-anhydromuramyl-L-alanine amidase AmpD